MSAPASLDTCEAPGNFDWMDPTGHTLIYYARKSLAGLLQAMFHASIIVG